MIVHCPHLFRWLWKWKSFSQDILKIFNIPLEKGRTFASLFYFEAFLLLRDSSYLSSLGDRKPVTSEDEIIVMVVPDYQMLAYVEKVASELLDDPVLISFSSMISEPHILLLNWSSILQWRSQLIPGSDILLA